MADVRLVRVSDDGLGWKEITSSTDTVVVPSLRVATSMVVPSGGAFPGSPVDGEFFWRTDTNVLYRYDAGGPAWESIVVGSVYGAKAGSVSNASFAGNPKTAAVVFATAEPDTNYAVIHVIHITGNSNAAYIATIENKTVNGFDICMHTGNINNVVAVDWSVQRHGS